MANIQDLLADILSARYGEEVRGSIHDAIEQCYKDGQMAATDLVARADIATLHNDVGSLASLSTVDKTSIVNAINELVASAVAGVTYALSKSGSTITLTGSDGSTTSVIDDDTKYNLATTSEDGLMPMLDGDATKFLAGDGTWQTPSGGGGTGSRTLLWTNPDTSANFEAQTIALDLSQYRYIDVIYYSQASASEPTDLSDYTGAAIYLCSCRHIAIGETARTMTLTYWLITSRGIKVTENGVEFGHTVSNALGNPGTGRRNDFDIPAKIYGYN